MKTITRSIYYLPWHHIPELHTKLRVSQSVVPTVCPCNYHCSSMAFHLFAFAFEISAAKWFLWCKIRQRLTNNIISGSRTNEVGWTVGNSRQEVTATLVTAAIRGNSAPGRAVRPPTAVKAGGWRDTVTSFCTAPASERTVRHGRTCCHHRSWRRKQQLATKSTFLQSFCYQTKTQSHLEY